MKRRYFSILLICYTLNLAFLQASSYSTLNDNNPKAKKKVYVLLFTGQSNALGWGYQQYLEDTKHPLAKPQSDIEMFYSIAGVGYLPENTLIPMQSGNSNTNVKPLPNHYPDLTVAPISRFGPELTFARTVKDNLNLGDNKLVIIKYAQGGTSIYKHWIPDGTEKSTGDGPIYKAFQNVVNNGLKEIKAKYPDYDVEILGMGWVQGESDALDSQGIDYQKNLENFIADVRLTYGSQFPFVFNKISPQQIEGGKPHLIEQWEIVRRAQDAVASKIPLTATTETLGEKYGVSKGFSEFQYHYTTPALMQIGTDLGHALVKIIKTDGLLKNKKKRKQ